MNKPDILIFMSDQHTSYFTGYYGHNVDTPNLDHLVSAGVSFDSTYTPCPLCVPARMAMMSVQYPFRTGVYTNDDTLSNLTPTFLHPFVEAGYETVLCGRMHFVGQDQCHGFTKRIAPDTTPVSWSRPVKKLKEQRGVLRRTFADAGAVQIVGGGESPVIHYDRMVVDAALKYLSEDHEKPQLMVVGTYGPHFPYIAPTALFNKYMDRMEASELLDTVPEYMNDRLLKRRRPVSPAVARGCAAAYCGLIELMDGQIGEVYRAFDTYTKKRGSRKVFCYLSDHGDQVGDRSLFGKDTFFEKSVKVPMIFTGDGVAKGQRIETPTSILDLGPTLLAMAGVSPLPGADGVDLSGVITGKQTPDPDRIVFSELMDSDFGSQDYCYGRMAVSGPYKYVTYDGYEDKDMLFDISVDSEELHNLILQAPEAAARLKAAAADLPVPGQLLERQRAHGQMARWLRAMEAATYADDSQRWQDNPPTARGQLEVAVTEPVEERKFT